EASGAFDAVWVGDSILSKPRLESLTLLSAVAARTQRLKLGVGCLATFAHRQPVLFALQWASLDVISGGRSLLAVCLGGPDIQGPTQALEHKTMGILSRERVSRLEEGIAIVRRLFHEDHVTYHGKYHTLEDVTLEPKPVQQPCPIWIASNPTGVTFKDGAGVEEKLLQRALRRVARYADGWQTNKITPAQFADLWGRIQTMAREEGRDPARLGNCLYHNLNVNPDREAAYEESKRFLDAYYLGNYSRRFVDSWTTYGPVERCIAELKAYFEAGVQQITLRFTSWDQLGQMRIFLKEIVPAFGVAVRA
ncbi:MAG: LLM class flavin-dependent oxidoreductase, partial [Armatimonadetes bacterium]|nr:LLM class flavin-dependent oxidoreductase [Armatimonadota bacterium]